jgi:hypothetical protein
VSTPEEKLNSPTREGPARCTLEQLRARWGLLDRMVGDHPVSCRPLTNGELAERLRSGDVLKLWAMGGPERWRVEKIEGKRVDLVQEVEKR